MRYRVLLFLTLIFAAAGAGAQQLHARNDTMPFLKSAFLPQGYYTKHLGFFCKKELQLQKLTRMHVFVRLGSKDYVDYLEQKPNARR